MAELMVTSKKCIKCAWSAHWIERNIIKNTRESIYTCSHPNIVEVTDACPYYSSPEPKQNEEES